MRSFKLFLIFLFISTLSTTTVQAQILKKLKKRVQEATEEVIEEKASQKMEQESDKALDSLNENNEGKQSEYEEQIRQMMSASSGSITVEDSYTFDTKVAYKMIIEENGNRSEVNYEMWFPTEGNYMATKVLSSNDPEKKDMPTSVISILDDDNQAMIMLMEEQKMAQLLSMDKLKGIADKENTEDNIETEFPSITSTGKTKKILGYLCEEFASQNDTNRFTFWVTKELSLFQKNMFFNISKSLGGNTFDNIPENAKGLMMEMTFENYNSKEKGEMTVTGIDSVSNKVSMSDYQVISLGQ